MRDNVAQEVESIKENYLSLIRERTKVREIEDGWFAITTHHVDSNNDYIEVCVKKSADGESFFVSDDGIVLVYTIGIIDILKKLDGGSGVYENLIEYFDSTWYDSRMAVSKDDVAEMIIYVTEIQVIMERILSDLSQCIAAGETHEKVC